MKRFLILCFATTALFGASLIGQRAWAQTPAPEGFWQGMLRAGEQDVRVIVRMERRKPGELSCFVNIVERVPAAMRCGPVGAEGAAVRFSVPEIPSSFEGAISVDGQTLEGTWTSTAFGPRPLRLARASPAAAWPTDSASHKLHLITAGDGVRLEVLEFGGQGPPLLLVSGLGGAAHALDPFAMRLAANHRVYTMTRRGFGLSDQPAPSDAAYSTRRLGDDVLAVIDALKLDRPILAGFSFGGAEVSSVASRHPEKIAAAIYLEAAYAYGYYAAENTAPEGINPLVGVNALKAKLSRITQPDMAPAQGAALVEDMLRTDLPQLQADLAALLEVLRASQRPAGTLPPGPRPPEIDVMDAIIANTEKFGPVSVPVLTIFAIDSPLPPNAPESMKSEAPRREAEKRRLIDRYRSGNPKARVVEIKGATHAVFASHPDEVLREMDAFLAGLAATPGRR